TGNREKALEKNRIGASKPRGIGDKGAQPENALSGKIHQIVNDQRLPNRRKSRRMNSMPKNDNSLRRISRPRGARRSTPS
uniref:Uncharacterized protein n=1 Tax=Cucumis melo TaxID=3656 RepID=A0A9I9E1L3_CUCME